MGLGVPSLAVFLSWVFGSRPWLFFFHHVHLARVSSNLPLVLWLTASLAVLSSVSGKREKEREKEREKKREKETERKRQRERKREREREKERKRERER